MMDILKLFTIVSTVITVILAFFDKDHKKYEEYKDLYYQEILIKFFDSFKKNKDINAIRFMKKNLKENYYIPSYIFYLIRSNDSDRLKKILINDYLENYPMIKNNIRRTLKRITNRLFFLEYLGLVIFSSVLVIVYAPVIKEIIIDIYYTYIKGIHGYVTVYEFDIPSYIFSFIMTILAFLYVVISYLILHKAFITNDEYSFDTKYITKLISKKIKEYNKKSKEVYFLNQVI